MISPETLRRFSLFAGLSPADFKSLALMGDEIRLDAGDWLFHEDDPADALYLILNGKVDLEITTSETGGDYTSITTLVEGEFIGWSALIEPHVYRLGAVALTDATLVRLDSQQLRDYVAQNPDVCRILMRHLAQAIGGRLQDMRVRLVSLTEA